MTRLNIQKDDVALTTTYTMIVEDMDVLMARLTVQEKWQIKALENEGTVSGKIAALAIVQHAMERDETGKKPAVRPG